MRNFFYIIVLVCVGFSASSQQDPSYSMYLFDKMLVNPAFSGSSNYIVASIKNRDQFVGLPGHPATKTFNIHSPIQKYHVGIGGKIISDKIGPLVTTHAAVNVSYHLSLGGGRFSLGLEGGTISNKIQFDELTVNNRQDATLLGAYNKKTAADFSYSAYYHKKQFYAGLANYHVLKHTDITSAVKNVAPQLLFLAGNVFTLTKQLSLETAILFKHIKGQKNQADFNLVAMYNDRFGAGMVVHTNKSIGLYCRIGILENLRLAYAYDMKPFSSTLNLGASHEILLSYGIKLAPPPVKKEIHPRYYY